MVSNAISAVSGNVVQAGTIVGGVHFHTAGERDVVPRQLPPLSRGFAGRDDLLAVLDAAASDVVAEQPGAVAMLVLSGMAGVGKTTLAVQWAHRVASSFPDGQLYVDLSGYGVGRPADSGDVLAGFLRALGVPPELIPVDTAERTAKFRSVLSGRRVLVVLDNARSEQQVRPLLPGSGSWVVVVTSRNDLTGLVADQGAELVRVDVLAADDALDVLRVLIGSRVQAEPIAAMELVRRCAYLPLALRIVSGLARTRPATTLTELTEALADEPARLDVLDTGDDPRTAVRSVFSWSYKHLSVDATRLFRLLGLVPGCEIGIYAVAALADVTLAVADRLTGILLRAQLLREVGRGRVEMHDLLRVYAAELADNVEQVTARRAAVVRLFDYYLHAAERADRILSPNRFRVPLDGVARPGPVIDSHEQAVVWLTTELNVMTALFRIDDPALDGRRWQLAYTLRGYFFLTKDWDTWIQTHSLALTAAQRLSDPYAEASTRNNLGLALLERGMLDAAEPHYLQAKLLFEQVGDLRGMSNALGNLAWILHGRGDHQGALDVAFRALENYQRCGARTNAGITLHSIAVFEAALGKHDDAREHLARAMTLFSERGAHLNLSMALNYLGELHRQTDDLAASEQAHKRALAIAREQGSRYEQANAHNGLGHIALLRGDRDQAKKEWQQALELYTELEAVERQEVERDLVRLRRRTPHSMTQTTTGAPGAPFLGTGGPPELR